MAVKKRNFGKVLKNVLGYDIRSVEKYEGAGTKRRVSGSSLGVFAGKRMIKDGFKNKEEAISYIKTEIL